MKNRTREMKHHSGRERVRRSQHRKHLGREALVSSETRRYVGLRRWTRDRSPHGNTTAREQFGRQQWKRRLERSGRKEEGIVRRRQTKGYRSHTRRNE